MLSILFPGKAGHHFAEDFTSVFFRTHEQYEDRSGSSMDPGSHDLHVIFVLLVDKDSIRRDRFSEPQCLRNTVQSPIARKCQILPKQTRSRGAVKDFPFVCYHRFHTYPNEPYQSAWRKRLPSSGDRNECLWFPYQLRDHCQFFE